ncbi:uncharacterized protein LOC130664932 [Microplitis mediator]|uniref:uncharacterized protein LOC130664932 n=1 Tax=Microplitis mediator TaxID=375433 RepID=UPI00255790EE|nr:uncharacterized protein LOC130664932 [Microplitis mediator]
MDKSVPMKYSVIQFPGSFDSSVHNSYICIPNLWIINREKEKVIVAVPPDEEVPVSLSHTLKNEPPSPHWKTYAGILEYETHNLDNALHFIVWRCKSICQSNQPTGKVRADLTPLNRTPEVGPSVKNEASTSSSSTEPMTKLNFVTMLQIVRPMIVSLLGHVDMIIECNQNRSLFHHENCHGNNFNSNDLVDFTQTSNTCVTLFQEIMQNYMNSHNLKRMSDNSTPSEILSLETVMYKEIMSFLDLIVRMMKGELQQ